ncbi:MULTISPECIES: protein kinase domain-containing protein [Streptomyces]|uniref:non-specific serine/threonine protein kinase n=1 Tax=Streptomyces edwardsiae TaxID=3075527 RepID=A0ABU2Q5A6_9ACTN|nr:protein kinase [Streptomyces sp. DSM 41636]MDT0398675.1 protein kinase [Streptomyces sp. DSM 41636]
MPTHSSRSWPSSGRPARRDDSAWSAGSTVLGEFVVERPLGQGGFGAVVLAVSRRTGDRYAVKRVHRDDPVEQGRFLTEAQRWIGLPPHPHITPCHFTRTVGSQLAVFSEYVAGGSLADWIADGRLYAGAGRERLRTVLRIAVEAAWGLAAAHAHGLLHLDTKPGNVLLTGSGAARITDFGLATGGERDVQDVIGQEYVLDFLAREGDGIDAETSEVLRNVLRQTLAEARAEEAPPPSAVAEGVTPGYASPEQAEGRPLGRAADLWSWAVTVLEMFTGGRSWPSGTLAGAALETHLETLRDGTPGPVAMPEGVVALLRACFRTDPRERPESLHEAADSLVRTAVRECGIPLPGDPPPSAPRPTVKGGFERRLPGGAAWQDPRELLGAAYEAAGRDPGEAVRFWPSGHGSRASQSMEDLRALTEAAAVLDTVRDPDESVRLLWARVVAESGRVRQGLGDLPGAVEAYRAGARALRQPAGPDRQHALSLRLAVLHSLATVLRLSGSPGESVAICDQVLDEAEAVSDPVEAARIRGTALGTKANAVDDPHEQIPLLERAIDAMTVAGEDEGLALALAGRAAALERTGRTDEAAAAWERADALIEGAAAPGRTDLDAVRAALRLNRAVTAKGTRDAAVHARAAIALYEPLVHERGRHDVAGDLGRALLLSALGDEHAGRPQQALAAYRSARSLLEDAVLRDGRLDYVRYLAQAHDHESTLVRALEDPAAAVALARRAVEVWDRLGATDGRDAWLVDRAEARRKLADAHIDAGDGASAAREFDEAERVLGSASAAGSGGRLVSTLIHTGRAVLLRRSGKPEAACREIQLALDALGTPAEPQEEQVRVRCLQTLNAALGDLDRHKEALAVADQITTAVESLFERGEVSLREVADARQRRVNVLLRLGHVTEAQAPAHQALREYRSLIDDGRTDLVDEAARLRGALSVALHRSGDLDGAVREMETMRRHFAERTSYPWQRLLPRQAVDTAASLGAGPHAMLLEGLDVRLADLAKVRDVRPRDVDRLLADLARRREELMSGSLAFIEPDQVSQALEDLCGSLVWLAERFPRDAVHEACVETALVSGATAMRCLRDGAAERGFRLAVAHGRVLVLDRGRTGHLERWCSAHLAQASWQTFQGEETAAERTISDMETHLTTLAPSQAPAWSAHARRTLTTFRRG